MRLDLFQVDAFASRPFEGNPAAVCPLPAGPWPTDEMLQAIALENNLSETAFFKPDGDGFRLRWFTPGVEVKLCGHATLASAWVLFNELGHADDSIGFETLSGRLTVARDGERLVMDFPANPPEPLAIVPEDLQAALGGDIEAALISRGGDGYYVAVYRTAAEVAALRPDFGALAKITPSSVTATAPGTDGYDFVSRMFAPAKGVDEDPVTGSAHCVLTPYWSGRLGKQDLKARQISARGGDVGCSAVGSRVRLSGSAALYLRGQAIFPGSGDAS